MKKSLKLLCVVIGVVFTIGQAYAGNRDRDWHNRNQAKAQNSGDVNIAHNQQVVPYLPDDIKSSDNSNGIRCDLEGNQVDEQITEKVGMCITYRSKSNKSNWVVRYAKGTTRIFKLKNGKYQLYIAMDDPKDIYAVTFTSEEAKKFLAKNGGDTKIAKNQGDASNTPPKEVQINTQDIIKGVMGWIK